MAWTDGVDQPTGFLVTAAIWNNYLGAAGSLQGLKAHVHAGAAGDGASSLGPVVLEDFTDAVAPAAPSAGRTRIYSTAGRPRFRPAGGADTGLIASGDAAGGDLGGTYPNPTVAKSLYNYLTNPGLLRWQRGTGPFTANAAYAADRWQINLTGTDTVSVAQETTIVPDNAQSSLKCVLTAGAGTLTSIRQQLKAVVGEESHYSLRGATVSLSMRVRSNSATTCRAYIKSDGTAGTTTYSTAHTGGSTFETLTVAAVVIPADATYVEVGVEMKTNTMTVYLGNATLVTGSVAQAYYPLTGTDDWARCERYYQVHGESGPPYPILEGNGGATLKEDGYITYPTRMAVAATATKNGTWTTVNTLGQPIVNTGGVMGSYWNVQVNAAGAFSVYPGAAGQTFSFEANP